MLIGTRRTSAVAIGDRSRRSDDVDFDPRVLGQPRDLHGRARRRRRGEVGRVDLVHRGEVVHVREEDRGADDVVEGRAGGLRGSRRCCWKTRCVCAAMSPSTSVPGRRIERDLARDEQQRAGPDRLRIRADGLRGRRGRDRLRAWRSGGLDDLARPQAARADAQARMPPFTIARTRWRFGSNRRGVTLCAWLTFRPTTGPFPQISQRFAMTLSLSEGCKPLIEQYIRVATAAAQTLNYITGAATPPEAEAARRFRSAVSAPSGRTIHRV